MRARLTAELDGQVQALEARQADAVAEARRAAEAEAEARWASKLDAQNTEWSARLDAEVAAARDDTEKRLAAESTRLRAEADATIASERERAERAEQDVQAERQRGEQELEQVRAALEAERDAARQTGHEQQTHAELDPSGLIGSVRAIDGGRTLGDVLGAIASAAAAQAPRAALFVANGPHLDEWPGAAAAPMAQQPIDLEYAGMLKSALARGSVVFSDAADAARTPPAVAGLPAGRRAVAVPLLVGGQGVGVLYADEGVSETPRPGWTDAIELVARHGAAALAHVTAARAVQVRQGGNGHPAGSAAPDDEQSARRYAKLLVSEIKLYNEGAVRVGREKRDLLHRLRAEIERARRLYDERVSPAVPARAAYFQQELVQTLAGGDPALLGS
jgi:hypothetical protein